MAHHNTIFYQLMKLVPRHEFESLARKHHHGAKLRKMNRWTQFTALAMAQLTGRVSLRDLTASLSAQARKLYHFGCRPVSRASLARVSERKTFAFYEELFAVLLKRSQSVAPKHKFRFKNKLFSLDATFIDLCLSVFPWARFRQTKGAVKLHLGLDHDGYLPAFLAVTPGKIHELNPARFFKLPQGSIVVFDRAYIDYAWFNSLNMQKISFVTRMKSNTRFKVLDSRPPNQGKGVLKDQTILFTGARSKECRIPIRRIEYRDVETGKEYVFMTNNFKLAARTVADIYKERWQIEIFFKWIKQNLKIKSFLGISSNAVKTQIWVAICVYLLLSLVKFMSKISASLQQMIRLIHLNLFERRNLIDLLKPDPEKFSKAKQTQQLTLI